MDRGTARARKAAAADFDRIFVSSLVSRLGTIVAPELPGLLESALLRTLQDRRARKGSLTTSTILGAPSTLLHFDMIGNAIVLFREEMHPRGNDALCTGRSRTSQDKCGDDKTRSPWLIPNLRVETLLKITPTRAARCNIARTSIGNDKMKYFESLKQNIFIQLYQKYAHISKLCR